MNQPVEREASPHGGRRPSTGGFHGREENRAVWLAGVVQFVVLLDFSLLLPFGPDLVEPLAIPASSLGLLTAGYTGAAALSGLSFARVLDRWDRRRALQVTLLGLTLASASGALASNFEELLITRILAGICAAPTAALLMSIIADEVPVERHGAAMGAVISANALASVAGVPACLWLADWIAWWAAFVVIGVVGIVATLAVALSVRSRARALVQPISRVEPIPSSSPDRTRSIAAHALIFFGFAAAFAITPNLSTFVQLNLGYPRSSIPLLYMVAGTCALASMRITGSVVDRFGALLIGSMAIGGLMTIVLVFLAVPTPLLPVELAFIFTLVFLGARNVALRTATARVPDSATRGRFMSLQTTAQHLGAGMGSLLGMALLYDQADGRIAGMPTLALCSAGMCAAVPVLLWLVERRG
jgi:predicted MFS family arabinose efflux permease